MNSLNDTEMAWMRETVEEIKRGVSQLNQRINQSLPAESTSDNVCYLPKARTRSHHIGSISSRKVQL